LQRVSRAFMNRTACLLEHSMYEAAEFSAESDRGHYVPDVGERFPCEERT